ncbi:MAG: hypothetical protein ACR2JA_07035 [Hydrogenophaga sp.]|uniref:hypothetical protein n=1 Tax=Hydrogenophaga sp. TaxID=1904254 RepID=UPI003D9BF3F1
MGLRGLLLAALGLSLCSVAAAAPPKPSHVDLLCDAVYLPARSGWARTVRITFDDRRVQAVAIDGLLVYSFNVQGTTVLTALDNERIQIDTAELTWRSDFRGQATSQGRCERQLP